ncbi:uncharacterized protein LOC128956063 [Oppia nitens]|uniref:uncharacterized protein LOC128956063 n=1 Tax=Oppia nitens TaxID=1686743 RepID=UPI0023DB4A4B|nr:uncharacterized protein LOC128956063 [Oppia nitens]
MTYLLLTSIKISSSSNCLTIISLVFIIIITSNVINCQPNSQSSLCQSLPIYSIDRFPNRTVRLFRESDYWDLTGFPDKIQVSPSGRMTDYEFLHPVRENQRLVTVLAGHTKVVNRIYKFGGMFWWSWYENPVNKSQMMYAATEVGFYWDELPKEHGFAAVFHNGDTNDPILVGLEADRNYSTEHMKIHYFSTKNDTFVRKAGNYYNEKYFPIDVVDAFSWPLSGDNQMAVYIIKSDDTYCELINGKSCSEWKPWNRLLGCKDRVIPTTTTTPPPPPTTIPMITPDSVVATSSSITILPPTCLILMLVIEFFHYY